MVRPAVVPFDRRASSRRTEKMRDADAKLHNCKIYTLVRAENIRVTRTATQKVCAGDGFCFLDGTGGAFLGDGRTAGY